MLELFFIYRHTQAKCSSTNIERSFLEKVLSAKGYTLIYS